MSKTKTLLSLSDFITSFMWVCSGALIKIIVYKFLGFGGSDPRAEFYKASISIINMFFFSFLATITKGGSYNPLTVLSSAISGDITRFLFTIAARIPVQIIGSIVGVKLIIELFPGIHGPRLNVGIHHGALLEGFLTFSIVSLSLGLAKNNPGSFFMRTWISSVSKLALHILGSDLTGGCMNPASATAWAYADGSHFSKDHLVVYWLAPVMATLSAIWVFELLPKPSTKPKED